VALDFITKLPLFKELMTGVMYDSIMIVTDRLTKYAYFISYLESSLTEDLVYIFHKHVVINHRFPQRIISNRDKLFISRFWKSLMDLLGIYHKLSTNSIGISPFFTNYEYYPFTPSGSKDLKPISEQAKIQMNKIKELH
jgi:hypothetical protein